jgi:fringe-like protein
MGFEGRRNDTCLRLLQPVNMLSRRAITILSFAFVSLFLIAVTSRGLGAWHTDGTGYTNLAGSRPKAHEGEHRPPPPPPSPSPHGDDLGDDEDDGDYFEDKHGVKPPAGNDQAALAGLTATEDLPFRPHDPLCDTFPDTSRVLVVMKTGATESYNKIPTQVSTMLKCLPEYFIYSDHEETIGGYHIRDSLDTILNTTMDGNRDFDLYRRQKACAVDQESCNKLAANKNEGWNLDKYKNVHMAEKVYALRPNYDWYLFIDADTYVLFPTLMQWLPKLDHTKSHYLGSVTMLGGYSFAHGGSGYLVSQTAMKAIGDHPGIANELEPIMSKVCCGDYVFAVSVDNTSKTRVRNMVSSTLPDTLQLLADFK